MRPVRMDKMGVLAAVMYTLLAERKSTARVVGFKINVEVIPGITDNQFGCILGSIQVDYDQQDIREFSVRFVNNSVVCEIKQDIVAPKPTDEYTGCYLNVENVTDIEIDFNKRTIRNRRVCEFNISQLDWSNFTSLKGIALDIIGMILAEQNSV